VSRNESWLGILKENELLEVLDLDGVILKFDIKDGMVRSTYIWMRIGTNDEVSSTP
jgi:hypothetical protein